MPKAKRKAMSGRGTAGKAIVAGAKDRATNRVSAAVVDTTDKRTLQRFIADRAADDAGGYQGMPFDHEAVNHSAGEYVRGMAHTQGIESFWATLKRAHKGTFHKLSPKHLHRYVTEFAGKHNSRDVDTVDQMNAVLAGMVGKRLMYRDLVVD